MFHALETKPKRTRGRLYQECDNGFRNVFQRDRDRIIHSTSFRRLKHKTQVFIAHEGDHFRTRLTHTIEVSQVARTIAKALGLNSELSEAIALAHDLGHTPFGHVGEDVLNEKMQNFGGFDHNAQAIKIVTALECHYALFDGLNLTWETLEGLAKHNGPVFDPIPYNLAYYNKRHDLELRTFASSEAQIAAIADDIAYTHHDLDDGLRAALFAIEDLQDLPIIDECFRTVDFAYPNLEFSRRRHEVLRRFFGMMVDDVIKNSSMLLRQSAAQTADDIRGLNFPVIQFSDLMYQNLKQIREFLFRRMYRAERVNRMRDHARRVIEGLFDLYLNTPSYLPENWACCDDGGANAYRVTDYLAGMTDSFAQAQYEALITP